MGRASEYRKRAQSALADVTVPSGAVFKMRAFDPADWMGAEYTPDHILQAFLDLQAEAGTLAESAQNDPGVLRKFGPVMNHIIAYCAVDPVVKIEEAEAGEDDLWVKHISYEDRYHLFLYLTKQLPDAAVATRQGSVTVDAVTRFREGESGQEPTESGANGAGVQSATVTIAGRP